MPATNKSKLLSFVINRQGLVIQFSSAFADWLGYSRTELEVKTFQQICACDDKYVFRTPLDFSDLQHEEVITCTIYHKGGRGTEVKIHVLFLENVGATSLIFCNVEEGAASIEEQLKPFLENKEESFLVVNKDLNIVRFNKEFQELYKKYLGKNVVKGKNIMDYAYSADREHLTSIYAKALSGEHVVTEIVIPHKDDISTAYFSLTYKPLLDVEGIIEGVFVSVVDITEKKSSEQLLNFSEQRYKALVEHGMDVVVILTAEGKPVYVSPAVEKILGYTPEEGAHLDLFSLTHPDDMEKVTKVWEQVIKNPGIPMEGPTTRILHKNGTWRWLKDTITNMLHDPHINGIVDNFKDVTDKVLAEQQLLQKQKELEQAEANYREIFEKANEGILIYDIETSLLTEVNHKACELLGSTEKDLMSSTRKQYESDLPGYGLSAAMRKFKKAVNGKTQLFEWPLKRKDGVDTWLELSLTRANIAGTDRILAFFRVIDARKKAEDEKEFQRIDKEALINSTKDLMWSLNEDRKLVAANEAFISMMQEALGYKIKPGHDLLLLEKFPEGVINLWAGLYDRAFMGERVTEEVFTPAYDNIPQIWTEISINPVFQNGKVIFLACYARDISETKRQQQQIRLVNEKLEISQQIAKLGVWELDLNTGELYSSEETYRIYGLQKTDGADSFLTLKDLIHPQDKASFDIEYQYALAGEKLFNVEHRIITSTGLVKTVIQRGSLRYDSANNPATFSGTIQDITDRKYMENQLLASQRQLNLIYNTVSEIIFVIDVEEGERFRFQSVNQAFLTTTGLQSEQVINKLLDEVIPPVTYPFVLAKYKQALRTGQSVTWEETTPYPTGEKTGVVRVSPILNEEGKCLQLIGSVHDITDLRKSGEKLVILNEKLQAQAKALADSNLELERFAYVASHDLQEPLRMVSSFLKLLEKKYQGQLDQTADQYIHYAVDGSERMKKLIMDLLAYSRVSTNEDVLTSTDMNTVVADVLHIQHSKIVALGATVTVGSLPVLENTRRTQMFQLLQNLIVNALKYHGEHPPIITIDAREEIDKWKFSVQDNGVGFEQEFADSVFVMFKRLHRRSEFAGTGIGLSVCKKIVEIHHGNIWVESVPNKGSTFYFTIGK